MPATSPICICRGEYAEILECDSFFGEPAPAEYLTAVNLIKKAEDLKLLPKSYYNQISRYQSDKLCYLIYDFTPDMVLIQKSHIRILETGNRSSKDYFIISSNIDTGALVEDANFAKWLVVKVAKEGFPYGYVLDRVLDRRDALNMAALLKSRSRSSNRIEMLRCF